MKPFILTIIFLASSFIECQITLNRALLEKWIPSYAPAASIDLDSRNIQYIEGSTFYNLKSPSKIKPNKESIE